MGTIDCQQGVSDRISDDSSFDDQDQENDPSFRETFSPVGRDPGNVSKECYSRSRSKDSRILLNLFPSAQGGWQSKTYTEPPSFKQVYQYENLSNANTTDSCGLSSSRGLVGFIRPQGRVLSCADQTNTPSLPEVCLPRQSLSIQSPTIRTLDSTKSVHQGACSSDRVSSPPRCAHLPLFRRLSHSRQVRRITDRVSQALQLSLSSSWIPDKYKEISSHPGSVSQISGYGDKYDSTEVYTTVGESSSFTYMRSPVHESRTILTSEDVSTTSRPHGSYVDDDTVCPPIHETYSAPSELTMECKDAINAISNYDSSQIASHSPLVGRCSSPHSRKNLEKSETICYDHNRRFKESLGSSLRQVNSSGSMETTPDTITYKLSGDASCHKRPQNIHVSGSRQNSVDQNRQYDCGSLYQQTGRNKVSGNVSTNLEPAPVVYRSRGEPTSSTPRWDKEYDSGSFISLSPVSSGMGAKRRSCSNPVQALDNSADRSICELPEQESSSVLCTPVPSLSPTDRCSNNVVEWDLRLCLSASSDSEQSFAEGGTRTNSPVAHCSTMDPERVVSSSPEPSHRLSISSPCSQRSCYSEPGNALSSQPSRTMPSRLVSERNRYIAKGLSQKAAATCMASKRPNTRRNYLSGWSNFVQWCHQKDIDPNETTVHIIIEYLQSLLDEGKSYHTVKSRVSAIADFHPGKTFTGPLGQHKLLKLFLKGAFDKYPPIKDRVPSWDLPTVLEAMLDSPFEPIETISIDYLTLKTAFLVAIGSARRVSELQALDCRPPYCSIGEGGAVLRTNASFLPKVASVENIESTIDFAPFGLEEDGSPSELRPLCVTRALKAYLQRTAGSRKTDQLFVTYKTGQAGRAASKLTIARWIRRAIQLGYECQDKQLPMGVKAHSTRHQSASWAELNVTNIMDICKQACWATPHTFVKHYKLDLSASRSARHAAAVLNACPKRKV